LNTWLPQYPTYAEIIDQHGCGCYCLFLLCGISVSVHPVY
jgi:hypothetical protein